MTSSELPAPPNLACEFVRLLAGELSAGKVDLPSFPEIAVRVRRVLSEPTSSIDHVVRVVGSEPALAARVMRLANSASLNRSGRAVGDLRTAINRLGYNMVRCASISFAMAQIRNANKMAGLEPYLDDLWQRSTVVAAFACVLARNCSEVSPDEAMLGGMMHGIGKLYVLTRAASHPELFANSALLNGIIHDWHAAIGKAILENWDFSEEMAAAIGEQDDRGEVGPAPPNLRDIIAVAIVMAAHAADLRGLEAALEGVPAARRLGLRHDKIGLVSQACAAEVSALSSALGA